MGGRQELDGLLLKYYSEEGKKGTRQSERDTEIEAKEIFRGESDEEKAGKRQRERWKETVIKRERDEKIEGKETERKLEIDGEKVSTIYRCTNTDTIMN